MDLNQLVVLCGVLTHIQLIQCSYIYRRHALDLNLDDNLISIGGVDYPYNLAVAAGGPLENSENDQFPQLTEPLHSIPVETCRPEFLALRQDHTMCLPDSPKVVFTGVTPADRELILNQHNHYRSITFPEAEDMQKMIWDEKLAEVAFKWGKQCIVGHDDVKARDIPGYGVYTGQCAAGGYKTWAGAIKGWYNEVEFYRFGEDPDIYLDQTHDIGHYVQIMQNTTVLVGCGYVECVDSTYRRYYMCNYASGNVGRSAFPYTNGTRCSRCPGHCVNGLCDCGGKFCFNGGDMNISTCECTCREIYTGDTCMKLECPEIDKWHCGTYYKQQDCLRFPTLKFSCPYMCGVCKVVEGKGLRVDLIEHTTSIPETHVSGHGCVFIGQRSTPERCEKLGTKGMDRDDCETEGGFYTCSDCTTFAVRDKHCPVMCGVCDPPCDGKRCIHGGTLDPYNCQCSCFKHFHGDLCQNFTCPEADVAGCANTFTMAECEKPFAISKCPYYCGVCEKELPCGGKQCGNRGSLDKETCQCVCKIGYEGDICQTFICPESDLRRCRTYDRENCTVPRVADECPFFCKRCKPAFTTMPPPTTVGLDVTAEPGVFLSSHGCRYSGNRPSSESCRKLGNHGYDMDSCESQGGVTGCGECQIEDVRNQCPVMCAVCDPPCRGKKCKNGGLLNQDTCDCECTKRYIGVWCETVFCPYADGVPCKEKSNSSCAEEGVTEDCPYMCGLCTQPTILQTKALAKQPDLKQIQFEPEVLQVSELQPRLLKAFKPQPMELKAFEPQPRLLKAFEPQPRLLKAFEPQPRLLKAFEPQPRFLKAFEPQPRLLQAFEPQPVALKAFEPQPLETLSVFISTHGCAFFGERIAPERCLVKGIRGFDEPVCESEGGVAGCSLCGEQKVINDCPVMCGACDPPCGEKTCKNGGSLKLDGSCDCKCPKFYTGERCQTLVCPDKDRKFCEEKVVGDCMTDVQLWKTCPYLCDLCVAPTTEPPPVYVSEHGCQFIGYRLDKDKCLYKGHRGFDKATCETNGGEVGCAECAESSKECPVMCGICDPPCGPKVCLNGGTLKIDGSCECKCTSHFSGEVCETLTCPEKDHRKCHDRQQDECSNNGLPACPYLCGLCIAPTTTTTLAPVFVSEHGCKFIGERPEPSSCIRRGRQGFDSMQCGTMGGATNCSDCSNFKILCVCPVMCGLCDPPCGDKKCLNEGTLLIDGSCGCKCQPFYSGEWCETLECPDSDKRACKEKEPANCVGNRNVVSSCPYMCGICDKPSTTPPPPFLSEFGCQFTGERLNNRNCLMLGNKGLDQSECGTEDGDLGCVDCVTRGNDCPIMCGMCDAPCNALTCLNGGRLNTYKCLCICPANFDGERCESSLCGNKTCQNGGSLKTDGSCDCKCSRLHHGDFCETLVCPKADGGKCRTKTVADCEINSALWETCPILCGICQTPPPPTFTSTFGCTFIGDRPTPFSCKKLGKYGLDIERCASEGGDSGCDDCVAIGNECPVMCGLCDAPCNGKRCQNGGSLKISSCECKCLPNFIGDNCEENKCGEKTCENGGVLKIDGSCECKCSALHVGDVCETLVCPEKDSNKCKSKTSSDCEEKSDLWEDCPILCGVCQPPPPPTFTSIFGCTFIGERPTSFNCKKLGKYGLDIERCASEGGDSGCDDCVTIGNECPVMCGICDAPCDGKRCQNGGSLKISPCECKCLPNFVGDTCEENKCGEKTCTNGGVLKIDGSCACKCSALHVGDVCETLVCPVKDSNKCKSKTSADCEEKSDLWEDCPILCGVCQPPPPPRFTSTFGCTYIGDRPSLYNCKKLGKYGLDIERCASEGGDSGCDDCVTIGNECPVMCGLCDAPCDGKRCQNGGSLKITSCECKCPPNFVGDTCEENKCGEKTCENGGVLKIDGSCECKCSALHVGDVCETLVCPVKDSNKCKSKTSSDCEGKSDLWEDCPILCGVCQPPPPPTFTSTFGCTYIGDRPTSFKCKQLGKYGLDIDRCASEGGDSGCDDCVAIDKECPVMCGLCDAPCDGKRCQNGGSLKISSCDCKCLPNFIGDLCGENKCGEKTCENGGVLKIDGSCECKCSALHVGDVCETLVCPVKDSNKCKSKTSSDCEEKSDLWEDCPILCGVCQPPPPPVFQSQFGCTFVGERPSNFQCKKLGKTGQDRIACATEGGAVGCDDCVTIATDCPVMCGLCDAPCDGKRCANGGSLNTKTCACKCLKNFKGDNCQDVECPKKDHWKCGKQYVLDGCDLPETRSFCPYMCALCSGRKKRRAGIQSCDLYCHHGGVLDTVACTCSCHPNYRGNQCQQFVCPAVDDELCIDWDIESCDANQALLDDCPHLCQRCQTDCLVEDAWYCEQTWDPMDCDTFSRARQDCPRMCQLCRRATNLASGN